MLPQTRAHIPVGIFAFLSNLHVQVHRARRFNTVARFFDVAQTIDGPALEPRRAFRARARVAASAVTLSRGARRAGFQLARLTVATRIRIRAIRRAAIALLAFVHDHVPAHGVVSLGEAKVLVPRERRGELVHGALRPTVVRIAEFRHRRHDKLTLVAALRSLCGEPIVVKPQLVANLVRHRGRVRRQFAFPHHGDTRGGHGAAVQLVDALSVDLRAEAIPGGKFRAPDVESAPVVRAYAHAGSSDLIREPDGFPVEVVAAEEVRGIVRRQLIVQVFSPPRKLVEQLGRVGLPVWLDRDVGGPRIFSVVLLRDHDRHGRRDVLLKQRVHQVDDVKRLLVKRLHRVVLRDSFLIVDDEHLDVELLHSSLQQPTPTDAVAAAGTAAAAAAGIDPAATCDGRRKLRGQRVHRAGV